MKSITVMLSTKAERNAAIKGKKDEELEGIEFHPSCTVKAQPPEKTRLIHRLDDRHHPEDEEDGLPVLIMEQILGAQE